jgi:hypothetical protein
LDSSDYVRVIGILDFRFRTVDKVSHPVSAGTIWSQSHAFMLRDENRAAPALDD